MDEDDTFKILRRAPFSSMRSKYIEFANMHSSFGINQREIFFNEHGWTVSEFIDMHHKLSVKLPHD